MPRAVKMMLFMLIVSVVSFSLLQVSVSSAQSRQVVTLTLENSRSVGAAGTLTLPAGSSIVAYFAKNSSDCPVCVQLQGNSPTSATLSVTEGVVKMPAMQSYFFDVGPWGTSAAELFDAPLGSQLSVKASWDGGNVTCPSKLLVSFFFTTLPGSVNAVQSGPWTVGIDPAQNVVSVAPHQRFYYNPGFNVIGGGSSQIDLGPFDLSKVSKLRVIARAFNNNGGDIKFELYVWDTADPFKRIIFDEFSLNEATKTNVYPAPPPSFLVRLTKQGGLGANYHVVLIGDGD